MPLIKYLEKYGKITPREAERIIKKSTSTAYRYLGILVDAGVLVRNENTNNLVYKKIC